jgi:hypothetical protein
MAAIASPSSQPYHSQQSGIAVWNNALYIHAADTLVAHGNLYLFNADVAGHGTLRLSDTASRRIVAHHSSLPHLIIDNTDTVALQGDLHIRCGLTLAQGVFDTRAANLTLSDSAFVHILPGSHWLQDDDVTAHWLPILPLLPPTARQALPVADIFPSTYTGLAARPPRQSSEAFFFCNPWRPKVWPSIPCPPPKENSESLVAA